MLFQVVLYPFGFGYYIARNEAVLDFMALHHGIVEDTLFQLFEQFLPADVAEILHIFQIDLAELVQGCRKGFLRSVHMRHLVDVERYGHGEYVRLLYLPVDGTLQ